MHTSVFDKQEFDIDKQLDLDMYQRDKLAPGG